MNPPASPLGAETRDQPASDIRPGVDAIFPFRGFIDHVVAAADGVYFVEGWANLPADARLIDIEINGQRFPVLPGVALRYERGDLEGPDLGVMFLVQFPPEGFTSGAVSVSLRSSLGEFPWPWSRPPGFQDDFEARGEAWRRLDSRSVSVLEEWLFEGIPALLTERDDGILQRNRFLWFAHSSPREGVLDGSAWASRDVLLLRGWSPIAIDRIRQVFILGNRSATLIDARVLQDDRADLPDRTWGKIIIAPIEERQLEALEPIGIVLCSDTGYCRLDQRGGCLPTESFDPDEGRNWDQRFKTRLMETVLWAQERAAIRADRPVSATLAQGLVTCTTRSVPNHISTLNGRFEFAWDYFLAIRPDLVFVVGWKVDLLGALESLRLVSASGQAADVKLALVPVPRADISEIVRRKFGSSGIEKYGFIAAVPVSADYWDSGAVLRGRLSNGDFFEVGQRPTGWDPFATRMTLLKCLPENPYFDERLMGAMHEALSPCQEQCLRLISVESTFERGSAPKNPHTSIIVTLFKRIDFLQHQMVHFSLDPALRNAEFIYVLDSPEDALAFTDLATKVYGTYQVPFRAAILNRNSGFAPANNIGARMARGRNLLFLNSDVFPVRPGWLEILAHTQKSASSAGLISGKLLFEDSSLQHAGMFFERSHNVHGLWWNEHYFKGLPSNFAPANVIRSVPAITGALTLVDRGVFESIGGWDESYLVGDFEDSDLSIRLSQRGLRNWYQPAAELWHLERQSQAPVFEDYWRRNATYYNCWLQTYRWSEVIEEIMRDTEFTEDGVSGGRW